MVYLKLIDTLQSDQFTDHPRRGHRCSNFAGSNGGQGGISISGSSATMDCEHPERLDFHSFCNTALDLERTITDFSRLFHRPGGGLGALPPKS